MDTLKEISSKIDVWTDWLESYKKFVPKFIEEAKHKKNWQNWDKDVFYEFFEKSANQCVSSMQQGYFTNKDKDEIKKNWDELAPLFTELANNQDSPQWDVYTKIKTTIRKYTNCNRKAATNRLIAGLQPKLLCTIVNEDYLYNLYYYLKKELSDENIPTYIGGDAFKNSYNILQYFQKKLPDIDKIDLITYPWQVLDYLRNEENKTNKTKQKMNKYKEILDKNKNIILTGAPGTGKTFIAKAIAKAITGEDTSETNLRCGFVQFHPSYDYTDFIEGLRPEMKDGQNEIGFTLKDGIFREFCNKAKNDEENNYVFVIDEINRGEISKIFGELFFSIEPNYRGEEGKVKTQYSNLRDSADQYFFVPANVYIIGTMNDIDRSVESFDFAMRRRFTWVEITAEESAISMELDDNSKTRMTRLNDAISKIDGLNSSYHIGAAYFLKLDDYENDYNKLWKLRLLPLVKEYLRGMPDFETKVNELATAFGFENKQ